MARKQLMIHLEYSRRIQSSLASHSASNSCGFYLIKIQHINEIGPPGNQPRMKKKKEMRNRIVANFAVKKTGFS